jgi:glutamate synthase domain-containing protein 2
MAIYECSVCGYIYDESKEEVPWLELPENWTCPLCETEKKFFKIVDDETAQPTAIETNESYLAEWQRSFDELEVHMEHIHLMAETGLSIDEPMRSRQAVLAWNNILIKGAQLFKLPLNADEIIETTTIIGPSAKQPLIINSPIIISHMSFGALSRETKIALAQGAAAIKTATCSGEGGILDDELNAAYKYIFEYVPNKYSVTDNYLQQVDAVEIKLGQSAKPGMGGHLPGAKVTAEIATIRGKQVGEEITSPAHFPDIKTPEDLKQCVNELRQRTAGKPIGIKLAAGHIEQDLEIALAAQPDFITLDGHPGATGSAPKFVKDNTSIPTIYALYRARKYFNEHNITDVSLIITGGLRISADFAKALALGADAVAIASAALIACGCQQYRICNSGKCPIGITTQDPELRKRLKIEKSAQRLENFLRVSNEELKSFARLTGNDNIHKLTVNDLATTNSEISNHTNIDHA